MRPQFLRLAVAPLIMRKYLLKIWLQLKRTSITWRDAEEGLNLFDLVVT